MRLGDDTDWHLTSWDGAKHETLRRWAALPLEKIVAALEEMQALNETLSEPAVSGAGIEEPQGNYGAKDENDSK